MSMPSSGFAAVLAALLTPYRARVPEVAAIEDALRASGALAPGAPLPNDHIAFRTFGIAPLGIASLAPLLERHGFIRRDAYAFADKHLDACWFAPPDDVLPRVFVSELRVGELPSAAAAIVRRYMQAVTRGPLAGVDLDDGNAVATHLETLPWPHPTFTDYQALLATSEYAAWTLVNGYRVNHLTFAVHDLADELASIERLDTFLEERGVRLSAAGGRIKTSPDGLLRQSSTVATVRRETFADGSAGDVAGSYIEFAERGVLPGFASLAGADIRRAHRREGFETANANRIFESTTLPIGER